MATRAPDVQARNQNPRDWGNYATAVVLPNTAGFVAPVNLLVPLEAGDTAYVIATTQRYVCTNPGVAGDGLAVWVPMGGGSGGGRYYDIIVGNAPAGDTLAVCDFLDTGNGMQWKAALAAAGAAGPPVKSVFTRRGVYNLGAAGSDGAPITIPQSVLNVGDGEGEVLVVTATNPAALATPGISALHVDGELWDVSVLLTNPVSANAAAPLGVMVVSATGKARRVAMFADTVVTLANLGAVVSAVHQVEGSFTEDIELENFPPIHPIGFFAGVLALPGGSPTSDVTRIIRLKSTGNQVKNAGGTVAIYVRASHVQITEPVILDALQGGIFVQAEEVSRSDVQITDPHITWRYADTVFGSPRFAIVMQANQLLTAKGVLDSVRVTRGYYDNFKITGSGSRALQFLAVGAGFMSVVKNCEVIGATCRNWDEAVHVEGTGISVVDANGIVDSEVSGTVGIDNVNDLNFRSLGNWSASAWAPSSSSDLALWINPASIQGVAPAVTGWNDLSGHAFNFAVVTGAPTQSVFTNGLFGVNFGGLADGLGQPATPAVYAVGTGGSAQYHVYIVAKQNGAGGADNTSAGYFHLPPYIADNGNTWGVFQRTVAGVDTIVQGARSLTATRFSAVPAAPDVTGTPICIHAWRTLDGLLHIQVGGGPAFTVAMDAIVNFAGTGTILQLAQSASGGFLACTIGEIFIIDGPLTNTEQALASGYVTDKWGVAA